jgi:F0F1-type ATP synthase delta subunit
MLVKICNYYCLSVTSVTTTYKEETFRSLTEAPIIKIESKMELTNEVFEGPSSMSMYVNELF